MPRVSAYLLTHSKASISGRSVDFRTTQVVLDSELNTPPFLFDIPLACEVLVFDHPGPSSDIFERLGRSESTKVIQAQAGRSERYHTQHELAALRGSPGVLLAMHPTLGQPVMITKSVALVLDLFEQEGYRYRFNCPTLDALPSPSLRTLSFVRKLIVCALCCSPPNAGWRCSTSPITCGDSSSSQTSNVFPLFNRPRVNADDVVDKVDRGTYLEVLARCKLDKKSCK